MRISYVVVTHGSPQQLERLISRLDDENVTFYVHLNLRIDIAPYLYLEKNNVIFLEDRLPVTWGDFTTTRAILNGLKAFVKANDSDYVVVLSGQCYPVKSKEIISKFFVENNGYDFISFCKVEDAKHMYLKDRLYGKKFDITTEKGYNVVGFPIKRVSSFKDLVIFFKNIIKFFLRVPINKYGQIAPYFFKERKIIEENKYVNATWFSVRLDTARSMLEYLKNHPEVEEYYTDVLASDELLFSSVLMAMSNYDRKIKEYIHYVDWDDRGTKSVPFLFKDIKYFDIIANLPPNKLFARKFEENSEFLDMIDKKILNLS